jgi:hypothetical protein
VWLVTLPALRGSCVEAIGRVAVFPFSGLRLQAEMKTAGELAGPLRFTLSENLF